MVVKTVCKKHTHAQCILISVGLTQAHPIQISSAHITYIHDPSLHVPHSPSRLVPCSSRPPSQLVPCHGGAGGADNTTTLPTMVLPDKGRETLATDHAILGHGIRHPYCSCHFLTPWEMPSWLFILAQQTVCPKIVYMLTALQYNIYPAILPSCTTRLPVLAATRSLYGPRFLTLILSWFCQSVP